MKYCPKCGSEIKNNMKFCQKCGAKLPADHINLNNEYCKHCGSAIPKGATRCPKCDRYLDEAENNSHSVATVIGYIFSFLVPLAAVVAGIYLLTQKNENVHKHGACIIIIAVGVMCITYLYYIKFL